MTCIMNCDAPTISRNYLFVPSWDLRERSRKNDSPPFNVHYSYSQKFKFNAAFHTQISAAANVISSYASAAGHGNLQWIGTDGTYNCKPLCHSTSNALDFTALKFSNTSFDMYNAWRSHQPLSQQRGYLAIWAALRIYCKTVLTNTYDSLHLDHIHADNDARGVSAPPAIRENAHSDTALVQTACNLINGANLTIDKIWGSTTERAYANLLEALGMSCLSPKTNYWHARSFFILIMRHGFASRSAGAYRYSSCG